MRRRHVWTAAFGAAAVTVALPLSVAGAEGGAFIANGDFQSDPVGATTVTGWTTFDDLVDLGVTALGGCTSTDTSDYTALRGWADNAEPVVTGEVPVGPSDELYAVGTTDPVWLDESGAQTTAGAVGARQIFYGSFTDAWDDERTDFYVVDESAAYSVWDVYELTGDDDFADGFAANVYPDYTEMPDPVALADDLPPVSDSNFWSSEPEFGSTVVDADTAYDSDVAPTSNALELFSDMSADAYGYVAHGPAVISNPFTTTGSRTVTLDWAASGASDDYHVLGYALNTQTCQQIEVLDSTGEATAWQSTSVSLPTAGTYRFVFVAGTYDQSWGGAAGAVLYVDNVRVVPTITGTGIDLEPLFGVGDPVANAPIQLTGGGLMPNSPWTATLHSTPVTLATGVTDGSGNFWVISNLPASVEPGPHRIILSGTAPDGTPREDVVWITVAANGTIGYLSLDAPEDDGSGGVDPDDDGPGLAVTGADLTLPLTLGAVLVVAGAGALLLSRRRSRRG